MKIQCSAQQSLRYSVPFSPPLLLEPSGSVCKSETSGHTDWVRDLWNHLDICNSISPERWHLWVLKEQADLTAGPFSVICERSEMVIHSFPILKIKKSYPLFIRQNLENHMLN